MSEQDMVLSLKLRADGKGLVGEVRVTKKELEAMAKAAGSAGDETEKAGKKVDKAGKHVDDLGKKAKGAKGAISSLKGAMGALGVTLGAMALIETNREFSLLRASLETVTGSAGAAESAFSRIQKFAASTPFDLQQVTEAFIKLQALGLDPSERAMVSYGNTASAMGKSLNQMIEAVADAATGEFERLKEFGIKAKSQGDQVTFTFRGVSETVQKESSAIEAYLMRIGEVQFAGGMERQSKTLAGAISNLGDAWDQMLDRLVGGVLEGALTSIIRGISWVFDKVGEIGDTIDYGLRLMGFGADEADRKLSAMGDSAEAVGSQLENELADGASKAKDKVKELGDAAALTSEQIIAVEFTKTVEHIRQLEQEVDRLSVPVKTLAESFARGEMSQEAFNQAMEVAGKNVVEVSGQLEKARAIHDHYVAILKRISDGYVAVGKEEGKRKTSLDAMARAEQAHQKTVASATQALVQQYIELTNGARAAYEYSLRMQGFTDAEVEAQLALYDTVKALEEKRRAEEDAVNQSETHAKTNEETASAFEMVWKNAVDSVDNIFRDLWRGAFDSAKDFGQSLKEWFMNLLAELAHQAITRPIVLSLGASFSGGGLSGAGGSGGIMSSFTGGGFDMNSLTSLFGGSSIADSLNGIVGIFNGGSGVGAGFAGPPSPGVSPIFGGSNLGFGLAGIGGGLIGNMIGGEKYGSIVGSIGGMAGYSLATGALGSSIGEMTGVQLGAFAGPIGMVIGAVIGGLISAFTEQGEAPTKFKLSSMPDFVESGKGIDDIRRNGNTSIGYRDGAPTRIQVDTAFGSLGGGIQHTGKDGQLSDEDAAKYLENLTQVFQGLAGIDDAIASLLDSDKLGAVKEAMVAFEQDLVNKKPQDIEAFIQQRYDSIFGVIGDDIEGVYLAMKSVSADADITAIVGQVAAFFTTLEGYQGVFDDYTTLVEQGNLTLTDIMRENTDALLEQVAAYDGSIEANAEITNSMAQRYQLELQYLAMIDAAHASVNNTIDKSLETIRMSQMGEKERYDYLKGQAEALSDSLSSMTDPQQIADTVNEIDRLTMAAWNSLSEDQQSQVAGGFEEFLDAVRDRANEQLEKSRSDAAQEHDTLVQAYTDMAAAARELAAAVSPTEPNDQVPAPPTEPPPLFDLSDILGDIRIEKDTTNDLGMAAKETGEAAKKNSAAAELIEKGAGVLSDAATRMAEAAATMKDAAETGAVLPVSMMEVG